MNSSSNPEGTNRSSPSHRFVSVPTAPSIPPSPHRDAEWPLRGVRTLSSVLKQVLLDIKKGGQP